MQVHFKIHGQGKKNLNGDGLAIWYTKERIQKGERVRTQRHHVYFKRNSVWSIFALCILILSQVLYLEIWTTSLAWESLWTLIPTRRNTSRYAEAAPLPFYMCVYMFGKSKGGLRTSASHRQTLLKTLVKGLCVLLCNHWETGTEEKIYSSHTGNLPLERLISNRFLTSLSSLCLT